MLHVLQSDEDASVRRTALKTVSARLGRTRDPNDRALVGEVRASRALVDPDEGIRRATRELLDRFESPPAWSLKKRR